MPNILTNQTLYQCEYCGKRLLTKRGCILHENDYCWHEDSPHKQRIKAIQNACRHENTDEVWGYIPGEAVMQPEHRRCVDCGKEPV